MCPARARPCLKQKLHSPRLRQQLQSPQLEAGASHTCRPSTACGAGSGRLTQTSKQKKQHFFLQIGHHARPRRARICTPHDEAQARFHARRIFPGDMHMACGPGSPELSKSYMDMASKLFTLHLHLQSRQFLFDLIHLEFGVPGSTTWQHHSHL